MKGFFEPIEKSTVANTDFRRVLYTGHHMQLVLMTLAPGEEIGLETHTDTDQFFRFEHGVGQVLIAGTAHDVRDGDAVIVPAGAKHNVINTSETEPLALYTIYAPAHHKDGTVHATKAAAESDDEHFDGVTSE